MQHKKPTDKEISEIKEKLEPLGFKHVKNMYFEYYKFNFINVNDFDASAINKDLIIRSAFEYVSETSMQVGRNQIRGEIKTILGIKY